jgi:23S rRNA (uracil1939-C5)-methyltransferase
MFSDIPGFAGVSIWRDDKRGRQVFDRVYGARYRYEIIAGTRFRIHECSFFQINTLQAETLAALVKDMACPEPSGTLIDAYGGVGLFSLTTAPVNTPVTLFDNSETAVEDSRCNAEIRGMRAFEARCGDAGEALAKIHSADLLIADPPRTGLGRRAVTSACALGAPTIIYISCNPATLARDCKIFTEKGYTVERVAPIDMFPHTYHIETVVKIRKASAKV